MAIDPALIDVDHQFSGWLDGGSDDLAAGSSFPDSLLVPRSDWKDAIQEIQRNGVSLLNYAKPLNNQHPESSCVYNATEAALRAVRTRSLGAEHEIKCSPMSGYCRVARSRHSGSYMWEALEQLEEYGLLPEDTTGNKAKFVHTFHQNTPFVRKSALPDGWEITARHFRALEWLRIDSKEQFASSLLNGYPVVYGRSGHCICAMELIHDGRFYVKYLDSYGPGRGDNGCLFDTENKWSTGGAWGLRACTLPHDPSKPAGDDGK